MQWQGGREEGWEQERQEGQAWRDEAWNGSDVARLTHEAMWQTHEAMSHDSLTRHGMEATASIDIGIYVLVDQPPSA